MERKDESSCAEAWFRDPPKPLSPDRDDLRTCCTEHIHGDCACHYTALSTSARSRLIRVASRLRAGFMILEVTNTGALIEMFGLTKEGAPIKASARPCGANLG